MSLQRMFQMDDKKQTEGVSVTYATNPDGTVPTFTLARMGRANKRYLTEITRLTKPVQRLIDANQLGDELADAIVLEAFVDTVLLGWEHVQLEKEIASCPLPVGTDIVFNRTNAHLLLGKGLPELFADLREQAQAATLFRDDSLDVAAKN